MAAGKPRRQVDGHFLNPVDGCGLKVCRAVDAQPVAGETGRTGRCVGVVVRAQRKGEDALVGGHDVHGDLDTLAGPIAGGQRPGGVETSRLVWFDGGAILVAADAATAAIDGVVLDGNTAAEHIGRVRVDGQAALRPQRADVLPRRRIHPDHVGRDQREEEKERINPVGQHCRVTSQYVLLSRTM